MRVVIRGSLAQHSARGKFAKLSTSWRRRRNNAAMSSVCFRSLSARRFLICATSFLAIVALSVAAKARDRTLGYATAGPRATPDAAAPMRFVKVRSDDVACRPNCPEFISAEGKIVTGSADALERTLNAVGGRRLPIVINSAGGAVDDAMAMGRLIRAKRLAVVVAHTTLAPCPHGAKTCGEAKGLADSRGAYCASACTLALAGGVERYVGPTIVRRRPPDDRSHPSRRRSSELYKVRYLRVRRHEARAVAPFRRRAAQRPRPRNASPTTRSITTSPTISPRWASPIR